MLPLVGFTLILDLLTVVDGFFDNCPVDKGHPVFDILQTFYHDLQFVRASTSRRQSRDYSGFARDMISGVSPDSHLWSVRELYRSFADVVDLLRQDRIKDAEAALNSETIYASVRRGRDSTYLKYLQTEVDRLLGNNEEASSSILYAYLERGAYEGVSINDLERLDGLVSLQRVSQFNRDIDKSYGLDESPDYRSLSLLHLMVGRKIAPLSEIRRAVWNRLYETTPSVRPLAAAGSSTAESPEGIRRVEPQLDDLSGQSVAHSSAESILCEFAQKLQILGVRSSEETSANYSDVMNQLRRMDPFFAEELSGQVVANIETDLERARSDARDIWANIWSRSAQNDEGYKEIFACYFSVELSRQSEGICNLYALNDLLEDFASLKYSRKTYEGVSLSRMFELESKVVLLWLKCFHERLKLAYGLTSDENNQQLAAKRSEFGTCDRVIPQSILLQRF